MEMQALIESYPKYVLTEFELKEYMLQLKHYTISDKDFVNRLFLLIKYPYEEIALILLELSKKEFNESEHYAAMNQIPL